jgi:hypothetical protein
MLSAQERDRERRNTLRLLNLWDRVNVTRCREPRAESLPIIALIRRHNREFSADLKAVGERATRRRTPILALAH